MVRIRLIVLIAVIAAPAAAQTGSARNAVDGALSAPAQPRLAPPGPAAAVQPGEAQVRDVRAEALNAVLASGDIRAALSLGATPAQIAQVMFDQGYYGFYDGSDYKPVAVEEAYWVRLQSGRLGLATPNRPGAGLMGNATVITGVFGEFFPPGDRDAIPLWPDGKGLVMTTNGPPNPPDIAQTLALRPEILQLGGSSCPGDGCPIPPGPGKPLPEIPPEWLTQGK